MIWSLQLLVHYESMDSTQHQAEAVDEPLCFLCLVYFWPASALVLHQLEYLYPSQQRIQCSTTVVCSSDEMATGSDTVSDVLSRLQHGQITTAESFVQLAQLRSQNRSPKAADAAIAVLETPAATAATTAAAKLYPVATDSSTGKAVTQMTRSELIEHLVVNKRQGATRKRDSSVAGKHKQRSPAPQSGSSTVYDTDVSTDDAAQRVQLQSTVA
eukprot:19365-Heterococcus_DN1.PRE.3